MQTSMYKDSQDKTSIAQTEKQTFDTEGFPFLVLQKTLVNVKGSGLMAADNQIQLKKPRSNHRIQERRK